MHSWFAGDGRPVEYTEMIEIIEEHHSADGTVYIGSDTQPHRGGCIMSSAIVLHGAYNQRGGKYFISREVITSKTMVFLATRILAEAERTIQIAQDVATLFPDVKMELHVDISNTDKETPTSNLASMIVGYVTGNGFDCKLKPEAFAAASVADKHSK
jgi:predicted RNase H-related nuclease YkuK (DUF458 family)